MKLHSAAATGFARQAHAYQEARPSYNETIVAHVVERFGAGRVVDLGSGTGKFTEQLVAAGVAPIAVEPVTAMRGELHRLLPTADVRSGSAEAIPVEDNSVDTVVVAQAFHWFNHELALEEIARALVPGGALVTVWNVRDNDDPLVQAYTQIIEQHAGDTPRHKTMLWRTAIDADSRFELVDDFTVANPWDTDVDGVVNRALSTSFIGALEPEVQHDFVRELRQAIEPFGPHISYAYRGELQAWRLQ